MQQKKYKIYLVDDDEDDLEVLTAAFYGEACASKVKSFLSPNKLLTHLHALQQKDLPDLIILDHRMPMTSGSDAVKTIRAENKFTGITLAIYSTMVQKVKVQEMLSNGVDYYIQKGSSLEEIRNHVKGFCAAIKQKQGDMA